MKKFVQGIIVVVLCVTVLGVSQKAHAATLLNASASATTSRPSPSSVLSSYAASGSTSVAVVDNTSTFLSSDSAKLFKAGAFSESINVATTSADRLTITFTSATTATGGHGARASVLTTPITAMHSFIFTTQNAIPLGGTIEISYPAAVAGDTVQASPSANTWMFNGQSTANMQAKFSVGTSGCTFTKSGDVNGTGVQTPKIICTTTAIVPAGTTVTLLIGCSAITGASCTTQVPQIINPTNNSGLRGISTVRNIEIATYTTSGGSLLDNASVKMGTIESVFVVAHIDPTFTFRIDGVAASTDMDSSSTFCGTAYADTVITNSQYPSTPTDVNFGTITSANPTYSAQKFTITSNTSGGYAITATSSGFLLNPATGIYIPNVQGNVTANNTPAPASFPAAGTGAYGISPCDDSAYGRVNTTTWGQAPPLFANPSSQYFYNLITRNGALAANGDISYVVYAAQAGSSTPPGDYWQIMTYTASATF